MPFFFPIMASASAASRLGAALMYILAAMSLNIVNKLVLSIYKFNSFFLLIFAQNFIAVVVCSFLKQTKLADVPDLKELFTKKNRGMFLVSFLNIMNILASFSGLQLVNIPVFLALRKLTTLVIVLIEVAIFAKWPTLQAFLAVCLACAGGVYSGVANLDAEWFGYFYTLFSDVATALYIISLKRCVASHRRARSAHDPLAQCASVARTAPTRPDARACSTRTLR